MDKRPLWSNVYKLEENNPGWSKPGPDKNIGKIIEDILKDYSGNEINILDIGCGNGRNSLIFDSIAKPLVNYTGVDFADAAIEFCQKTYGKNREFIRMDITDSFNDLNNNLNNNQLKQYDIIFDCGCFHCIPPEKRKQYIKNITLLSTTGTIFVIGAWFKKDNDPDIEKPRYCPYFFLDEWFFNRDDIEKLFSPSFRVSHTIVDTTVYPGINDGYIYFILNRNE
ncbi:MAG: class I SAM-dependent methyltransferase [bacterium]|nr:class I SAM-dependent methyltransferase [bacterium]